MFYSVQYMSGRNTTTGQPNSRTGRMSIACNIGVFTKKSDRECFLDSHPSAEKLNSSDIRSLCLGDSVLEMNDYLESIVDCYVSV